MTTNFALTGKLVTQTEVKSSPDVLFDIFAHKPYQLVNAAPDIFLSLNLLDGLWGLLGSILSATYVDEGKTKFIKVTVVAINEVNKSVTYVVIGGGLLDLYTTLSVTFQVATDQDGKNIVTWTMDYLKLLPITPDPTSLMNLAVAAVKEVDAQTS